MSKSDTQRELVPRLRFPEFRDAPGWKTTRLGDALRFQPGYPFPSSGFNEGGIGLRLIRNRDLRSDDAVIYYSSSYDEAFVVDDGDVLIGMDGDFTPCVWDRGQALLNQRVGRITPKAKNDLQFLRYFLTAHLKDIEDATPRTTVKHLSHSDVERLNEALPEPAEQQKIAACLGSLDGLIVAEGRKLVTLRDHKQGLMQQLFPREGETRPRLRFPEFRDAGEWEERLIEEFFLVGSSKRVLQQDWTTEGVPFYRTRELVSLSKNEPFSSEVFISEELFSEISEKYGVPAEGDFLVSGVGTLGIAYQVHAGDRFYFKDGNVLWLKLTGYLISDFFKYCFQSGFIQNQISGQASVSTVGTYTIQNAKKTRFLCPVETDEQQRIADCLSALDTRIAAQAEKLDALRTHKRGLMQQLFPSPDGSAS